MFLVPGRHIWIYSFVLECRCSWDECQRVVFRVSTCMNRNLCLFFLTSLEVEVSSPSFLLANITRCCLCRRWVKICFWGRFKELTRCTLLSLWLWLEFYRYLQTKIGRSKTIIRRSFDRVQDFTHYRVRNRLRLVCVSFAFWPKLL